MWSYGGVSYFEKNPDEDEVAQNHYWSSQKHLPVLGPIGHYEADFGIEVVKMTNFAIGNLPGRGFRGPTIVGRIENMTTWSYENLNYGDGTRRRKDLTGID